VSGTTPCRVFLLRHGQAQMPDEQGQVWNYSEAALTPAGRRRAAELATALESVRLDAVFTSDLRRARETAEAIASPQGTPVIPDARLRELNIGNFEGMTLPRLRQVDRRFLPWLEVYFEGRHASPTFHVPADLPWPGGESVAGALGRVLPAFLDIVRNAQGQTVALCSHAYVLQALLCHIVGADVSQYWTFAGLPASLTLAEVGPDGRGVLRTMNGNLGLAGLVGGRLPLRGQETSTSPPDEDLRSTSRVFLARHGQSMVVEGGEPVYSHHPIGLTTDGRRQAERLAATLAPVRLDAVYTSDLNRARETAEFVADAQGLKAIVIPELIEISLGDFEGMTLARVHAEHERFVPWLEVAFNERFPSDEFHHPAELVFPNGESVLAVYERVVEPFLRIVRAHLGGTVAVISHGWVLQPLLCHILGAPITSYFRLQLRYAEPTLVEVDTDGLGVLEVLSGGTRVHGAAGSGPLAETKGGSG
jgi:phosphoserine phosphatase